MPPPPVDVALGKLELKEDEKTAKTTLKFNVDASAAEENLSSGEEEEGEEAGKVRKRRELTLIAFN